MSENNKTVNTPSSFWGIGGMSCVLLSLAVALLLVFAAGAAIGGAVVGLLGITVGLTCMGIGVAKNSSAIEDMNKMAQVSKDQEISMHVGKVAEQEQEKAQTEQKSESKKVDSSVAKISKATINDKTKNQLLQ